MGRTKFSRRSALLCAAAGSLYPPASFAQEQREAEGGIGGTGIVGVLTDFSSLIVAGNKVQTSSDTSYRDAFGVLRESDLQLGDSLTVEALGMPDDLVANQVQVNYPLVGPVTSVEDGGRSVIVNGTEVRLQTPQRTARLGQRVAVLGLWQSNQVIGSRLAAARDARDVISGTVSRRGLSVRIGPVLIEGRGRRRLQGGEFATVLGRYQAENGVFISEAIQLGRFTDLAAPLTDLSVEGYLEPTRGNPGYRIAGLGHSFARNLNLEPFLNERVLFGGPYDGLFAADQAIVLPENPAQRRRLLRQLAQ